MEENTNKALAYNTIILYTKVIIDVLCGLFVTRFALAALGADDYGLYSVLGGIISFIAILNTIMVSTSNRFIAFAIGRGNIQEANEQFNVNMAFHVVIALLCIVVAYPIGDWYIANYLNYDGDPYNATMVFRISVTASIISFLGVPYKGLLMAKEKFIVFSLTEVICHLVKLAASISIVYFFIHKLFIYTMAMAVCTAVSTLVFALYCKKHYPDISKIKLCKKKSKYKEVFDFSAWVGVGAVATVGKNQGAAIVINLFFNTVMNTALGIANIVSSVMNTLAQTVAQPMAPQINKNYAVGNYDRCHQLLVMSIKFTYLMTLLISIPFFVDCDWILQLWLGRIPEYASAFIMLLIADLLIMSLNSGISNLIFASGKLALYQSVVSILNIASVVIAYFVLKTGVPAYYLFYVYIAISISKVFIMQWILHKVLKVNNAQLIKESILPSIFVTALIAPCLLLKNLITGLPLICIALIYGSSMIVFVGLTKSERVYFLNLLKGFIKK